MVFSSLEFLIYFLPIFMVIYGIATEKNRNVILFIGSIFFYAMGEPKYLLLLLVSIVLNYFIGLQLAAPRRPNAVREKRRRTLFILAILVNVGMLAVFKGAPNELGLPLGISFYTFQLMSYLIDVYRGEIRRERSFLRLATYVSMFPQLVSGPIVNYTEVSDDLVKRRCTAAGIQDGLKLFIIGLVFKVLLADRIGILWNEVSVTGYESISTPLAWIAAVAYSMKIYFDFYGYSLMAIGMGRMLGFTFPENFHDPYMARGVRDFYRRWHMTLGRWFRKYVYIPLGGNRGSEGRTILNLLAVWILTSLWHGGSMNFLAWGIGLWFLIVLERQLDRIKLVKKLKVLPRLYLWCVIPVTWMCFAITDISQLQIYLGRMFNLVEGINVYSRDWQKALSNYWWLFLLCFTFCTPLLRRVYDKVKNHPATQLILGVLFWLCVRMIIINGENTFMYFRF